jgi:hypothetical protein
MWAQQQGYRNSSLTQYFLAAVLILTSSSDIKGLGFEGDKAVHCVRGGSFFVPGRN